MPDTPEHASGYLLGHAALEQRRLLIQASYVRPWTARLLRRAGLTEGMSVLDVGSGLGDVAFIAAEIVGPGGRVVGVERDPAAVEAARGRAASGGYTDLVTFANADLSEFDPAGSGPTRQPFDALVGRFVLQYLPDPAAALRRLAGFLRPGGIVVMHDMDVSNTDASVPRCPLWDDCFALLSALFRAHRITPDFGRHLTRVFLDAGLPWPDVDSGAMAGGKAGSTVFTWLGSAVQAVEPLLGEAGIALPDGLVVDDGLVATLERAVRESHSMVLGNIHYGAWTRLQSVGLP
ncbi:methyltransferase domain-containing protein [Actinomadura sp. DC4]|uniref:class I SAM-dependent methyltransferase n=1 Tax=Actinomadura sp. DC4 TaxID=3055069 RepID=UPI0025B1E8B9|nr:methyltransferase domain-containing protein [Actinomadura sp. DC4]MDN3356210.1 methyltransferase domain-containing protein [Actinomadura sp. DC4]